MLPKAVPTARTRLPETGPVATEDQHQSAVPYVRHVPDSDSSSIDCRQLWTAWQFRGLLSLTKHPRVFTASALRRVHDQRTSSQSHARQSTGHERDVLSIQDVGPEIDVARLHFALQNAWGSGKTQGRLRDVVTWLGLDPPPELFSFLFRAMRADQHSIATGLADSF